MSFFADFDQNLLANDFQEMNMLGVDIANPENDPPGEENSDKIIEPSKKDSKNEELDESVLESTAQDLENLLDIGEGEKKKKKKVEKKKEEEKEEESPKSEKKIDDKENDETKSDVTMNENVKRPEIHNIVSTVNMGVKVDCNKIAMRARNAKYNPKRFPAVILSMRDPLTTAFVFSTGKLTVLNAKTRDQSITASRRFAYMVKKIGYNDVKWKDFKISNILASAFIGFKVNLEGLSIDHSHFSSYEPEIFPGLVYKMLDPKVTLLVFVSGKIVIMGKSKENINLAFDKMYPILLNYKHGSL